MAGNLFVIKLSSTEVRDCRVSTAMKINSFQRWCNDVQEHLKFIKLTVNLFIKLRSVFSDKSKNIFEIYLILLKQIINPWLHCKIKIIKICQLKLHCSIIFFPFLAQIDIKFDVHDCICIPSSRCSRGPGNSWGKLTRRSSKPANVGHCQRTATVAVGSESD